MSWELAALPIAPRHDHCRRAATTLYSTDTVGYSEIRSLSTVATTWRMATLWCHCCYDSITDDVVCAVSSLPINTGLASQDVLHAVWMMHLDVSKQMTKLQSVATFVLQATSWEPIGCGDAFVASQQYDITPLWHQHLWCHFRSRHLMIA